VDDDPGQADRLGELVVDVDAVVVAARPRVPEGDVVGQVDAADEVELLRRRGFLRLRRGRRGCLLGLPPRGPARDADDLLVVKRPRREIK
jgi:hypothetical protein